MLFYELILNFQNLIKCLNFRYNATLSHKANHAFEPNSEFILFPVHPILGTIMGLAAIEDIPAGTEVSSIIKITQPSLGYFMSGFIG